MLLQQRAQLLPLLDALGNHVGRYPITCVVVGVAFSAKRIQENPGGGVHTQCERQRLDQRDVVPDLTG